MGMRFNTPGWPPAPSGFAPAPGWEPDPAWPPAPTGWNFLVLLGTDASRDDRTVLLHVSNRQKMSADEHRTQEPQ